jgi:hypothetical protein
MVGPPLSVCRRKRNPQQLADAQQVPVRSSQREVGVAVLSPLEIGR